MATLESQINEKYSEKCKKTTTYSKPIKRISKPKYSGGLVFTFSWPGESNRLSYSTATNIKIIIKQK